MLGIVGYTMKTETKYAYQKRIKELEVQNKKLSSALYDYRSSCMEIYDGCVEITSKLGNNINISWLLARLRRNFKD